MASRDTAVAPEPVAAAEGPDELRRSPMYVMPVAKLMELTRLPTHEEAMAGSMLTEWQEGMAPVLFVSQTWLGYAHPDDAVNSKCVLLKGLLQRAISGVVSSGVVSFSLILIHGTRAGIAARSRITQPHRTHAPDSDPPARPESAHPPPTCRNERRPPGLQHRFCVRVLERPGNGHLHELGKRLEERGVSHGRDEKGRPKEWRDPAKPESHEAPKYRPEYTS